MKKLVTRNYQLTKEHSLKTYGLEITNYISFAMHLSTHCTKNSKGRILSNWTEFNRIQLWQVELE